MTFAVGHDSWRPERREEHRQQIRDNLAAARRFRKKCDSTQPIKCLRCEDTGLVPWSGRLGQGGKRGPCPRCRVEASQQFAKQLSREYFPS